VSYSYQQLRNLPDEDLIAFHDQTAMNTSVGVTYALDELARREAQRQTKELIAYTNQIRWFTIAVAIFTVINVVVAVALLVE